MAPIPPQLEPYWPIIAAILALVDGLLLGLAIKKAIVSFLLALAAIILGAYIGVTFPGLSASLLLSKAAYFVSYAISRAPELFTGVSIFFLIGLAIGLWKG